MTKKKTLIILIVVVLIIISFGLYSRSCDYYVNYDIEESPNYCYIVYTECILATCKAPIEVIKCMETKNVCGKPIACTCTEKDNTEWIKVY